jgi:radical SAM protein with 4Fe4S-binding SPASM domain
MQSEELTTLQLHSIINDIVECGCLNLTITGGEPLIRSDFKEIYTHALNSGLLVSLFSNGTMIDAEMADFLSSNVPHKIEITLYGWTKETYETVTQTPNSYEKCMHAIELLKDRRMPLLLKTAVCNKNYHEVGMIKRFAKEHNLPYRFDAMLDPQVDGNSSVCRYRLTPQEVVALDSIDPERKENFLRLLKKREDVLDAFVYVCGAGENSFHIDPYGQLSMCMLTRYASYDLRNGSFKKGFYDFFSDIRSQKHAEDMVPVCHNCSLINLCTNCPGTSYLETGSFKNPSIFHCQVAKLREKNLIDESNNLLYERKTN